MIRPLILLLTVILAGHGRLSAQDGKPDTSNYTPKPYKPFRTSLGPKVFVGVSTLSAPNLETLLDRIRTANGLSSNKLEVSSDFTVGAGLSFETRLANRLSLLIEPVFMLYSAKINSERIGAVPADSTIRSEIQIKNDYVDVPLVLKFVVLPRSRAYILAGGAANFVTGGKVSSLEQSTTNS